MHRPTRQSASSVVAIGAIQSISRSIIAGSPILSIPVDSQALKVWSRCYEALGAVPEAAHARGA